MEKQDEIGGDTAKAVTKHTPGPWLLGGRITGNGIGIHVVTMGNGLVASVGDNDARCAGMHKMYASQHYDNNYTRVPTMEANARVIMVAPEMLAELRAIVDCVGGAKDPIQLAANLVALLPKTKELIRKATQP